MTVRCPPLTAALLLGTAVAAEPPGEAANPTPAAPPAATGGLRAVLEFSAEVTAAATAYLEKEGRLDGGGDIPVFEPKAVEFVPRDDDTVIDCDGDAYFDGNRRVLVYLVNVRAKDPRFTMKGANKLEVFFAEKPALDDKKEKAGPTDPSRQPAVADPAQDPIKKALPGGLGAEVGDLERIVATGAVLFKQQLSAEQINAGEKPIEASGAILTFQAKTEKVTLSGGFPWVRQGNMIQRAMKAEQTITIVNNEASFSPGGTQSIIPTGELQREQDRKREAGGSNKKDRPPR